MSTGPFPNYADAAKSLDIYEKLFSELVENDDRLYVLNSETHELLWASETGVSTDADFKSVLAVNCTDSVIKKRALKKEHLKKST